jgi:hypothetical protein
MKKIVLTLSIIMLLAIPAVASAEDGVLPKIEVKKTSWGNQFFCSGKRLELEELVKQLQKVPQTESEIRSARRCRSAGMLFVGAGGFMFGYSIGSSDDDAELMAIGLVSDGIGLFFSRKAGRHYEKAVEIYNAGI